MTLTPNEVITHLQTYIPSVSDKFSNQITGATATSDGNIVTVTAIAHGFSPGDPIVVASGQFENLLIDVVDNGDGTVRFETDQDHDLTEPRQANDPTTLTLAGIGAPWDGENTIEGVPNRKHFDIEFPAGETVLPTLGPATVLIEDRPAGIIGVQIVATVPDADTFTFIAGTVPSFPTGTILNFSATGRLRIYGASSFERAQEFYNAELTGEYVLFVVMGEVAVSKDRNTKSDATAEFTNQNFQKQIVLNEFSTYVFIPASNDAAGNAAVQEAYGEIYYALMNVLYGVPFDDEETAMSFNTVFNGHGPGAYNSAYYVHGYDWQRPDVVSYQNAFAEGSDVAFRDISGTLFNADDEEAPLDYTIDLDEVPLD